MRKYEFDDVSEIVRNVVIVNEVPMYTMDYITRLQGEISRLNDRLETIADLAAVHRATY